MSNVGEDAALALLVISSMHPSWLLALVLAVSASACGTHDSGASADLDAPDLGASDLAGGSDLAQSFDKLPYTATVNDPQHELDPDTAAVLANLDAAIEDWSHWLTSKGSLAIAINVVDNTATGRFSGGPGYQVVLEQRGNYTVYELSSVHKMRTGEAGDATQPDIVVSIQPKYMRDNYWIDPDPKTRSTPVPSGKVDLVTVLAHELGHGLGMEGLVDIQTGKATDGVSITGFDALFLDSPSITAPVLTGTHVNAVYGGPAPLTYFSQAAPSFSIQHNGMTYLANESPTQSYYHYGRFNAVDDEKDLTFFGLMAGAWINPGPGGLRIRVNALDAAILGDLGVPLKTP
jgi:hypothetical protein